MADQTIDSLNLQISASTQQAVNSINKLLTSLRGLNSSLKSISSSGVREYSKEIGTMATSLKALDNIKTTGVDEVTRKLKALSQIDLSHLDGQKIKVGIDLDINGAKAKNLENAIQKTIDGVNVNADKISKELSKSFQLDKASANKVKQDFRTLAQEIANVFDANTGGSGDVSNSGIEAYMDAVETIKKEGKVASTSFDDSIDETKKTWKEFYDYFNNHPIYVSDSLKAEFGASDLNERLKDQLRYIQRYYSSDAVRIDDSSDWWETNSSMLREIGIYEEEAKNADRLKKVLDALRIAKQKLESVRISDLSSSELSYANNEVLRATENAWSNLETQINNSIKTNMQGSEGQLPIDVNVNQDKIVRDIRNAINKVAELKYNAVKVNLNVDTQSIKESITQKLSEIDSGQLTGVADSMEKLSNSMQNMGGINYKDNGLNTIINSINRLIKSDVGSFDTNKLANIITELSKISTIPDVSNNVNRFVSSIAKLASAGNNVSVSANALPKLGASLKTVTTDMSKITDVSASMNTFVTGVSKLASAGNRTGQTAEQLTQLGDGLKNFMTSIQDAPNVSENILRMTEALGNIASSGSKASSFFGSGSGGSSGGFNSGKLATASNVVSKLTTNINRLAQAGKNGLSRLVQWFRQIGNSSGSLQTATYNLKNLFATIVGYRGISGILNSISGFFSSSLEGKGILEIGSDIAEIENVVDVSFGSMADKAYEFAESATEAYGLSELAAKEYSGTMMAMLKSSGLGGTQEMKAQAAEMSTTLAGLAGDMASFFNIDTDTAFYKIRAGISGEIEPLKQLGINMSVEFTLRLYTVMYIESLCERKPKRCAA